jgi:hypothetical protein
MSTQANYTEGLLLLAETLGEVKTRTERLESEFATNAKPIENATSALSAALAGIKALQFHITDNNLGALSARVEEMRKAVDDQVGVIALELKKADETNAAKAGAEAEALRSEIVALQSQLGSLVTQFGQQLERVEFAAKEEAKKLQLIPGPAGASLNPRGTFIDGETYNRLDVVSWLGSSYIATVDGVTEKPSKNSNQWQVLASRGGNAGGASMVPLPDVYGKPSNGQLLIGNGNDYVNATLTAGNGIAVTNSSGSITIEATGAVNYQGAWNASTNSPTLTSSVGTKGYYYVVSVAGSTNLNGITDWQAGDWAVFNGTAWEKIDNTDRVSSVFGRTGAVVGVSTDYSSVGITNTAIGASNPSTGAFTTLSATGNLTVSGTGTSSVAGVISAVSGQFTGTQAPASGSGAEVGFFSGGGYVFGYNRNSSASLPLYLQHPGGNVLIGTTTDGGQKLQVSGDAAISGGTINVGAFASLTAAKANFYSQNSGGGNRQWSIGMSALAGATNQYGLVIRDESGGVNAVQLAYDSGDATFAGNTAAFGASGTGGANSQIVLKGGSAANGGGAIVYQKNGTTKAWAGLESSILGGGSTSDNYIIYTASGLAVTVAGQNTTLAGNLTVSGTGTSSVAGLLNVGPGTANYSAAGRATVSISGGSQSLLGFSIGNATKGYLLHEGTNLYVANEAAGSVIIAGGSSTTSATFTSTLTTLAGNLTVSGTGTSSFVGPISAASDSLFATRIRINASGQNQMFGDGNQFAVAGGSALLGIRNDQGAIVFAAGSSNVQLYLNTSGNALFGTNLVTDSGNGRIQLATHTTSAGGIGFGTETALYRIGSGSLAIQGSDNAVLRLVAGATSYAGYDIFRGSTQTANFYVDNATNNTYLGTTTASSLYLRTNSTTALTLDSSQNATFAKTVNVGNGTSNSSYQNIYTNKSENTAGPVSITLPADCAGTVRVSSYQSGVGRSFRTIPFINFGGTVTLGTSDTTVLTADPVTSVAAGTGAVTLNLFAGNTNVYWGIDVVKA